MKTALVTGGAKRIGRAIVTDLALNGWQVVIHCRSSVAEAEDLISDLAAKGAEKMATVIADFSDRPAVQGLINQAQEAIGSPITLLVNNASLFEEDDITSFSCDGWDAHMDANLLAPAMLSQAFFLQLPEGIQGNIINIIDQRVWKLNPQFFSYTTSKTALWTATQTMAQAMAPRVRVNAIGPGPVLASIHQSDDTFAHEASAVPLGHGPSLTEIARTLRFITETPSMTGQMIALDGGQHLAWQTPDIPV